MELQLLSRAEVGLVPMERSSSVEDNSKEDDEEDVEERIRLEERSSNAAPRAPLKESEGKSILDGLFAPAWPRQ
jgi:hypothetical protein